MEEHKLVFASSTRSVFILLMIFTALKGCQIRVIDYIGTVGLYIAACFYIVVAGYIVTRKNNRQYSSIISLFVCFLIVLLFNNFNAFFLRGFINIFEVVVTISIFITWLNIDFLEDDILLNNLRRVFCVVLLLNYCYIAINISSIGNYGSFYQVTDYFGELMCIYFFLCIMIYTKRKDVRFRNMGFLFVPFVFASGSRTWSAIVLISTLFYIFSKTKIHSRKFWNAILIVFYFVMYRFINIYINASNTVEGRIINELSIKYFHKQFFSGRNFLWQNALQLISEKPYFGYGTGALYGNFFLDTRSIHSYYIQLLFQDGWIGLIIFVIITFVVWNVLFCKCNTSRYCAACFLCILLANFFEVSLLQNQMNFVFLNWLIISTGVSDARNCTRFKENTC